MAETKLQPKPPSEAEGLTAAPPATAAFFQRIQELRAPNLFSPKVGMQRADQTKYVSWDLNSAYRDDKIQLLQITDVQFGHRECNVRRMIEYRDWILDDPRRYMLWTGDMIDAATANSPGSLFEQIGEPYSQVGKFVELWAPAAHRVLGYVGGNHERRGIPTFGDLGSLIAMLLRIPYSSGRQCVDIYYGQHKPFSIALWHGVGSARTRGGVAQTLDRFLNNHDQDAHLYLMGHLHQPQILPAWRQRRNTRTRQIELRKVFAGISSSFLATWFTYGETAGFAAHDVLMICAQLERGGEWVVSLR